VFKYVYMYICIYIYIYAYMYTDRRHVTATPCNTNTLHHTALHCNPYRERTSSCTIPALSRWSNVCALPRLRWAWPPSRATPPAATGVREVEKEVLRRETIRFRPVCMCVYLYICRYMYVCIQIYICIYIHIYT